MSTVHHVTNLPYELESKTCTCRRRQDWINATEFSPGLGIVVHATCHKPTQDKVIFQCAECEEFFFSTTIPWMFTSVVSIARALQSPNVQSKWFKDVTCVDCS